MIGRAIPPIIIGVIQSSIILAIILFVVSDPDEWLLDLTLFWIICL